MDNTYITNQGDTWDMISYKVYGNEHHQSILINANIKYIHTVIFPANITLTIPKLEIPSTTKLPPWKRGVSHV